MEGWHISMNLMPKVETSQPYGKGSPRSTLNGLDQNLLGHRGFYLVF